MVARTPLTQKKMLAPLNPILIRETLIKVDRCMARLQELQYTVTGGSKVVSGVSLSPRSTRGYLRTSLRLKNGGTRKSPVGNKQTHAGEWRRMSLPAMLVGETVGEILQATQFAREIVSVVNNKPFATSDDPKTPMSQRLNRKLSSFQAENTEFKARRKKEKQTKSQHENSPSLQRARSRINFKVSPPKVKEFDKENKKYLANRVSPRNKPWAKKTVLFPNPLYLPTQPSSQQQRFSKTRSPIILRNRGTTTTANTSITTPHKFVIKSPQPSSSKVQVKKSPQVYLSSPIGKENLSRNSPKRSVSVAAKIRRSFSPSRLATRLVSPLKSRKTILKTDDGLAVSGLKQRPTSTMKIPIRGI
ncbi:hypothetical protein Ahy_B09g096574 isoform B [Arachis hypogaea]|uniref:Microtubule-binding protein TANGLED n=1 Tax=Arachis hypogaea TaxID=3818 RepID=A0A444XLG7_ARAHY|nr:hypothetical protein Ahy_B09g096574 isoform B [Arachis hypogaea]